MSTTTEEYSEREYYIEKIIEMLSNKYSTDEIGTIFRKLERERKLEKYKWKLQTPAQIVDMN